jgi:hypothetical protein
VGSWGVHPPSWKKAVVTLSAGDDIQFFDESAAEGGEE